MHINCHKLNICFSVKQILYYTYLISKEYNYAHRYLHMCTFRCRRCTPIYSRTFQDSPAHCERQERPSIQQYSSTVLISLSLYIYPAPSPSRKNSRYYKRNCMYKHTNLTYLCRQNRRRAIRNENIIYLSGMYVCVCIYAALLSCAVEIPRLFLE